MGIEITQLAIGLFFLWAFIYYLYRDYRVDVFREDLFLIRAELFEYAASGKVDFGSPEYFILRRVINQLIRYAHAVTLSRFLLGSSLRSMHPKSSSNLVETWKEVVSKVESEQTRNELLAFHNRVGLAIIIHMLRRSAVIFLILLGFEITQRILGFAHRPEEVVKKEDVERFEIEMIEADKENLDRDLVAA